MTSTRRLYEYFLPGSYELELTIERVARRFHGHVVIRGHKPHAAHPIIVHAKDLTIHSAQIDGSPVPAKPQSHDTVQIGDGLAAGDYQVTIEFSGKINDSMHGLYPCYYEHKGEKKELLATQFESHHAREVFPCIDEPEAKASFHVTLITESSVTSLSNMPPTSQKRIKVGDQIMHKTNFETTPRMSTYLLAFVIGELHSSSRTSTNGTTVTIYSTKAQSKTSHQFALQEATVLIDHFEDYFNVPYPLAKCDHVALPDFSSLAMENWGLITYREGYLLVNPTTSTAQRQTISTVIAHELAHQWFGNLVTMRWWNDLWLNESFANLMQYIAVDTIHPDWHIWDDFAYDETVLALSRDQFAAIQPVAYSIKNPDEISAVFDKAILYAKGSRLIRMLMYHVGEQSFRSGLQNYFRDFAYGNTDGDDLWRSMATASGMRIAPFMNTWLTQAGFPVVSVTRHGDSYHLDQRRFIVGGHTTDNLWPIPIAAHDAGWPQTLHERSYNQASSTPPILNRDTVSHFITCYDPVSFDICCQNLDNHTLSTPERLAFLYETYLLVQAGMYPHSNLFIVLEHCRHDTDYVIWKMIALVLQSLRLCLGDNHSNLASVHKYGQWLVQPTHVQLEREAQPRHDKTIGIINGILVACNDAPTVARALSIFHTSSDITRIDGNQQQAILDAVATHGSRKDFASLLQFHNTTHDAHLRDVISRSLCLSQNVHTLSVLISMLDTSDSVKPQTVPWWFLYLMNNHLSREMTWQWLIDHWTWLETTFAGDQTLEKFVIYAAHCMATPDWLARFDDFFGMHETPALRRAIHVGRNEITARIDWMQRDKDAIISLLSIDRP